MLTGTTLAWFAPLLEKHSPLLAWIIKAFQDNIGDIDSMRKKINKSRQLHQGYRPASPYVADFCLLACDIPWVGAVLMDQFCQGLCNDVKDLLLTFHEDPKSL